MPKIILAGDPACTGKSPKAPSLVPKDLLPRLSNLDWVDLRRTDGPNPMSIILPSGENFLVTIEGLLFALQELGISNPESVADYAWNFRESTLNLRTGQITCTYERNRKAGRP